MTHDFHALPAHDRGPSSSLPPRCARAASCRRSERAPVERYVPASLADRSRRANCGRESRTVLNPATWPIFSTSLLKIAASARWPRTDRPRLDRPRGRRIVNRDTAVVVREMFQAARESVLVAGYAVYQGRVVFKALAERMDQNPHLDVQMYLDIQRPQHDHSSPSDLVRRFSERFARHEWPGQRFPKLFYDPRSLETETARRASLHAKCVVVDQEVAFVSSANFTEAAQTKNIEVGILLRSSAFARRLAEHFEILASAHAVKPVPLTS